MMPTFLPRFSALRARSRAGYSLVEVLVVVTILSIGSTIALYQYQSFRESLGVDSSAQVVRRMMILAKHRAISTALPHEVLIDLERETIWVDQLNAAGTERKPRIIPDEQMVEDVVIDAVKINGTEFTTGVQTIRFSPQGGNPLITVLIRRANDDPGVPENFTSVRLYPSSSEPRIYERARK
jgi:prepilin-type N-terminal cleavage/methylation domain-containing protein